MKTITNNKLTTTTCITLMLLILTSPVFAYPPDPDNAALLYYQAYIAYEKSDDTMQEMVSDLSRDKIEPNERIRKYIENCRGAINLAVAAAEVPNCNWGLKYSDGFEMLLSHLAQTRKLAFIIGAETRILAADGDYQKALDRCLTLHKMSKHMGDETIISMLVAMSLSKVADNHIQYLLAETPQDLKTLTWLKSQLAIIESKPLSSRPTTKYERELSLEHMQLDKLKKLIEIVLGEPVKPGSKEAEQLRNVDQTVIDKNRAYYIKHMDTLQTILSTPMNYEKVYTELNKLNKQPHKDLAENNTDAYLTSIISPDFNRIISVETRDKTLNNAVRAAIEIYIQKAKTGQLPETLPEGLPKDLFSGKDFRYEKTADGFILRCRGKDLDKNETYQYEFKVK
ncbi:MAG: hypothetical protein H8D56_18230 [Planctomycetes bacterium]|nr:hypothetical protein [Planctomycetota bacterium]MBL7143791.1 hypothetical protein [Phycisphaerae bacterium]